MRGSPGPLAVALAVVAACAPGPPPSAPKPAAASDAWARASWEERHDTMTFAVLPNMARLFQRFDGARYPTTTCRTCHGADAEAVHYAMPHGLPALDPGHLPDGHDPDPRRARLAQLMIEEVTPQMADLIDVPVDDGPSRQRFCFRCHPSSARAP
jgi:hypothetical protein